MVFEFWSKVAGHYRDAPHLPFEVFSEPQGIRAQAWRREASELVARIRQQEAHQPVVVGGIEYDRDLSWVLTSPGEGEDAVYASQTYPAHPRQLWSVYFGDVAERHPVLILEWGFME
jgi:hypothetical protein